MQPHEFTGAADGPPLIWGHGLTQSRRLEDPAPLVDWHRVPARVVRYDARGHGESEPTADRNDLDRYSWRALAEDQLALADGLGIRHYIAAGASMGCGTALHAAVAAPDRIDALVLAIPPTAWETRAAQAQQWGAGADLIEREGLEPFIAAGERRPIPGPFLDDPSYQPRRAAAIRSWEPGRLAHVLRGATSANLPDRAEVAGIACPTLILAWTGDPAHPESTALELVELLDDAELHLAATADDLAGWTDLVVGFLTRLADR